MTSFGLAWRNLVRQPARAVLGILGVAAVGALLLDMLMLSQGLIVSFADILERTGFDIRVTATESLPLMGPRIEDTAQASADLASLSEVEAVVPGRLASAELEGRGGETFQAVFFGTGPGARMPWRLVEGQPLDSVGDPPPILINRNVAELLELVPGSSLPLRGRCSRRQTALPVVEFRVSGIVVFPFDPADQLTTAVNLVDLRRACGIPEDDSVDILFVASRRGAAAAVAAIREARSDLHPYSNQHLVERFEGRDFSYFRQISFALSTITLFFAFLLIAALLTVSVNQRFAEIAALRALGFGRSRVVADLLCESAMFVGSGGLLALPLGAALAVWLDGILRGMPGFPYDLHFFVFQPRALVLYGVLLTLAGVLAAVYPIYLAARLPIAATLRNEVIS